MKDKLYTWLARKFWKNAFLIGFRMGEQNSEHKVWMKGYQAGIETGKMHAEDASFLLGFDSGVQQGRSQIIDALSAHPEHEFSHGNV